MKRRTTTVVLVAALALATTPRCRTTRLAFIAARLAAGRKKSEDAVLDPELTLDDEVLQVVRHLRVVPRTTELVRRTTVTKDRYRVPPLARAPELDLHPVRMARFSPSTYDTTA